MTDATFRPVATNIATERRPYTTETPVQATRAFLEALFVEPMVGLEPTTCCLRKLDTPANEHEQTRIPHSNAARVIAPNEPKRTITNQGCNEQCNGAQRAFVELAWIIGDPSDKEHCRFRREWHELTDFTDSISRLCNRIASLAQIAGNVYISAQRYEGRSRASRVLPGWIVFVDDAPLDLECTFSVQTSPNSKHAYFVLNEPVAPDVLHELARRAAYALGTDKSGYDLQQIVRIPGTFNTKAKYGGSYAVMARRESGKRYTPAELRTRWPETAKATRGQTGSIDWQAVEHWLGNIDVLIGDNGLPRRFKNLNSKSAQILLTGEPNNRSDARCNVAYGLAMHGYPDAEIAAILWHLCDYGHSSEKGTKWLQEDIERIVTIPDSLKGTHVPDVRAKLKIQPSPTRYRAAAPAQPLPTIQRPKRGRKHTITPDKLLQFYQAEAGAGDMVMLTISEVATQLGVSRPTIERHERTLRERGAIERRFFNRRQSSCVAVLRPIINTNQAANQPTEHVPSFAPALPQPDAENDERSIQEDHTAHEVPPSDLVHQVAPEPLPTLRAAIEEAFDAYAGNGRNLTTKRIAAYLVANYPDVAFTPAALAYLAAETRKQRTWAKKITDIAVMPFAGLRKELRLAEAMFDRCQRRGETTAFWAAYRQALQAEIRTRPETGQRRVPDKAPSPKAARERYQRELLDQVEDQIELWRASTPKPARPIAPPVPAVEARQPTATSDDSGGAVFDSLLTKLRARKAAQEPPTPVGVASGVCSSYSALNQLNQSTKG